MKGHIDTMDSIKLALSEKTKSDHILLAKVFDKWRDSKIKNKAKEFTQTHFLNNSSLHMIRYVSLTLFNFTLFSQHCVFRS